MTDHMIGEIPLILKRHHRARNLKLRFDAKSGAAMLTLPPRVSERKALQFAERHRHWIREQQEKAPAAIPLLPDFIIPFRGKDHIIIHQPENRAAVHQETGRLIIGGPRDGFEVRIENWLKKQARQHLTEAMETHGRALNIRPHKIMVRDTKSRWGSCSSRKSLSFSWRLVMAPPEILSYVVAHEMAHLIEMNHSPAFWELVARLDGDWETSRHWLKTEGNRLMLIG